MANAIAYHAVMADVGTMALVVFCTHMREAVYPLCGPDLHTVNTFSSQPLCADAF